MNLEDKFIENSVGEYNIDGDIKWWTDIFYDNAYEIVSSKKPYKYPIFIPSYNRWSDPLTIKVFFSKMNSECNYPVFVVVRESQEKDYKEALKDFYGVKVLSFPDEEINNIGATRRKIVRWAYDAGLESIFMLDDDLTGISYTNKGYTKSSNAPIAKYIKMDELEVPRVFAMWQLSMEKSIRKYNVMCNGLSPMFSSWKYDYTYPEQSLLMRGLPSQCFCLNVRGLIDNSIEYRDTNDCGHEDIDLTIRIAEKGLNVSVFPFLVYSATPMRPNFGGFGDTMAKRMKAQQEIMMKNHSDKDWVRFQDKRGLAQVSINWIRLRKAMGVKEYKFNIWEHGDILN